LSIRAARTAVLSSCATRPITRAGLAAVFIAFGCQSLQTAAADGETRSLVMHHMHTGEDIDITFKRNGKYDDEALDKINWFLRDWRRQEKTRMDPHLLDVIWEVYREVGGKEPIQIVCGYRSPSTNAMLRRRSSGVAQFSQHTLGRATDFYIPGVSLEEQRYAGLRLQRGGVGYYPTSGSPFIHLDTGNVRHWPRMPEAQLARVLHDHRTIRLASRSGKPATDNDGAASETQKPKRNFLAKLFGFGEDEDEEAEASSTPTAMAHEAAATPAHVASTVPMPPTRPARVALASASTLTPSPADIVRSRVDWRGEVTPAPQAAPIVEAKFVEAKFVEPKFVEAKLVEPKIVEAKIVEAKAVAAPGAIGTANARFVWIAGPQGRATSEEPPRPKADLTGAAPETTASLGDWPNNVRNDRVPTEIALAYATVPPPEPRTRSLSSVVDVPRVEPIRPARPAAVVPAPSDSSSSIQKSAPRIQDPWLRGVVMAPSAYYSMRVALLGSPDYRSLAPLMRKPASAVAMVFTVDPYSGLSPEYFEGPAVAFVPTITFATRTAGLN
jgi:uncharacterized protein YcbK (DUF882 family)